MKKHVVYVILFLFLLLVPFINVSAHPGRTDVNGCHTCRTNCAKWGLSNGQYHCHNGGSSSSSNSGSNNYVRTTTTKQIYGCTNSSAINYNSSANISDGSCKFEKVEIKTEEIDYETNTIGTLNSGMRKVITEGETGEKEITVKTITDESGDEVSSEVLKEEVIKQPVNEVIKYEKKKVKKETKQENDGSLVFVVVTILLFAFNVIFGKKHIDAKLIINWVKTKEKGVRYILYFLYFIFILPVFIDVLLIINYFIKTNNKR